MDAAQASDEPKPGAPRNFGLVFAGFFAIVGLLPLLGGNAARWWALAIAAAFLAVALAAPAVLAPLNLIWFRFGLQLHRVMSPVVMALLFFLTVTPVGLLMRVAGKDPLRLKPDPQQPSYWIARDPAGPAGGSLRNQF